MEFSQFRALAYTRNFPLLPPPTMEENEISIWFQGPRSPRLPRSTFCFTLSRLIPNRESRLSWLLGGACPPSCLIQRVSTSNFRFFPVMFTVVCTKPRIDFSSSKASSRLPSAELSVPSNWGTLWNLDATWSFDFIHLQMISGRSVTFCIKYLCFVVIVHFVTFLYFEHFLDFFMLSAFCHESIRTFQFLS